MKLTTLRSPINTLVALLIASALLGGCSSSSKNDPSSSNTGSGGNVVPKQGSTYTYNLYQTDSTGAKVPGTDTTIIASVTASGIAFHGETNVYQVEDGGMTNSFSSQSNGDMKFYPDSNGIAAALNGMANASVTSWLTFFTGSHIKGDLTFYDTTITQSITFQGVPVSLSFGITGTTGYLSQETIQVGTTAFDCAKVHVKIKIVINAVIISGTVLIDNIFWYSPKLGYFAKEVTTNSGMSMFGLPASGTVQTLTSYQLK